jgi:copper chaperone CopZ
MNRFGMLVALVFAVGCAEPAAVSTVDEAETTTVAFNVAGAPTVEFNVPDMMCPEGCGEKTKEILSEQPGAKEVVINFEAKTATVAIEDGKFDQDAAIAALVDHGFEHSTLKSDDTDGNAVAETPAKPAG